MQCQELMTLQCQELMTLQPHELKDRVTFFQAEYDRMASTSYSALSPLSPTGAS